MSQLEDALGKMDAHTDTMRNVQLYLMQITELMRNMTHQLREVSTVVQSLDERVRQLEVLRQRQ